jgi:hypothetical protein
MVAEQLLRDPALFSGAAPDPAEAVRAYLDACASLEASSGLRREDGSRRGRDGAVTRAPPDGGARYSNWWANVEVVRAHVRRLLENHGGARDSLQRNTFRRAESVLAVDAYLRKRLRLPDAPAFN